MTNYWKTSDISITKDSVGYFWAEHKWAGQLIESGFYEDRKSCRRDAVEILMEKKEEEATASPFVNESWYAA